MDYQANPVTLEGYDEPPANADSLSSVPAVSAVQQPAEPLPVPPKKSVWSRLSIPVIVFSIIAIPLALLFALVTRVQPMTPAQESVFTSQEIDLNSLNLKSPSDEQKTEGTLAVNGQLSIAGSLQVTPGTRPADPKAGQIYYDETSQQLGYFNGNGFVYLQGGSLTAGNTINTTNVTNITYGGDEIVNTSNHVTVNNITIGPEPDPAILLQGGVPSVIQAGGFAIDGTGTMDMATMNTGNITTVNASTVNGDTGTLTTGNITTVNATTLNTVTGNITTGNITTGNLDVANIEVANIGLTNTAQIESGGDYFSVNSYEELPSGQSTNVGKDDLVSTSDTSYLGYTLTGQKVIIGSNGGPLNSISIYIGGTTLVAPTYSIQVGLYSDDGNVPSRPDTLMWGSSSYLASATPNDSWLTVPVPTTIQLNPFTPYWIGVNVAPASTQISGEWGFNPSRFNTKIRTNQGQQTICKKVQQSAGGLLNNFNQPTPGIAFLSGPDPGPCTHSNGTYSAYLNYTTDPSTGGAGAMFSLSQTGQASFRSTVDSTNAFKIQNAASATSMFTVDTYNMRVAIGKPTADYMLDIGNGDVNMTSGYSLRFGGSQAISGTTTTTAVAGGTVNVQTNNFAVQAPGGGTNYLTITSGAATFNGATTLTGATTATNTLTNRVSSATAFRVQNASSVDLLVANTSTMTLSVTGSDTTFANLTLHNTHFKTTQTTAPTISVPTNCGTSPTAAITTGSTDTAGSLTITTGTGGTSSTCDAIITFRRAYGAAPKSIIIVGKGGVPAVQRGIYVVSANATTFTISFANSAGGVNSTPYEFNYWVIE